MTGPTPPVPSQPPAGASRAAPQAAGASPVRIEAVVIGSTRRGAVIETAGGRLLLTGMPALPRGASLTLQTAASPAVIARETPESATRPARLLAIDGRALGPPRPVELAPVPSPSPRRLAPTLPAQVVAPTARAGGPPIAVQITPLPDARGVPPMMANLAAGLPPGAALAAEAAGRDARGRPLLRAPGLLLRLEPGAADLPPGARLRLVLPQGLPPATTPAREDPLRTLVDTLRAQESAAPAARALPRPDAALAARLLRLHEAVRSGDDSLLQGNAAAPGTRPGDAGPDRVALREALTELARFAREPLPGGWRASLLPVVVDGAPTPLRLYLRDDDGTAPGAAEPAVRRAVFDLDLSHLGRLQLDILCQGRRFDVLVRSDRALPAALREEVAALFEAAKDVTGLRGELGFRPGGLLALPDPRAPPVGVTA